MLKLLERLPKADSVSVMVERLSDRLLSRIVPDELAEAGSCSCGCDPPTWSCAGCLICQQCTDCQSGGTCRGCYYNAGCGWNC
jgi:hypothetical protein